MSTRDVILEDILALEVFSAQDLYVAVAGRATREIIDLELSCLTGRGYMVCQRVLVGENIPPLTLYRLTPGGVAAAQRLLKLRAELDTCERNLFGEVGE